MSVLTPRSPVFSAESGPHDKADDVTNVNVAVDEKPCSYVRIRSDTDPDSGLYHELYINGLTDNAIRFRTGPGPGSGSEFELDLRHVLYEDKQSQYRIHTIGLHAGADATTFEIIGIL